MNSKNRTQGFTLIELMIALAVLAVLVVVGVPSLQSVIANNRLAAASNDIVAALNVAKSEAIRQNASIRYCVNPTTRAWRVVTMADTDIRVGSLPTQVEVVSSGVDTTTVADNACVRFRPDGLSYGSGSAQITAGRFTLSLGAATAREVHVMMGMIRVE